MSAYLSEGAEISYNERIRQIKGEGWSAEHDDQYKDDQLLKAASCYIGCAVDPKNADSPEIEDIWPWDEKWFKPTTDIQNLKKAAALIMAEIDRRLRLKYAKPTDKP